MFGVGCFWLETTIIITIESHPFYPIICPWLWWGWSKKKRKKNQNGRLKKTEIFKTTKSLYFLAKISGIGHWVYRINWCERHGCGSTYMAVRLPKRRPFYSKKNIFGLLVFFWTVWQPYGMSHIHALRINLSYKPKDQSLKFWQKNNENWQFWKSFFFVFLNFFFASSPSKSGIN